MERNARDEQEEMHGSLVAMVGEQNARLTAVTKRQDHVISCVSDELVELRKIVKDLQSARGEGEGSSRSARSIKLDLARFSGEDPQGWVYQTEAYFENHGITKNARLQITDFYMSKEALSWIRGMKRNGLLT